LPRTVGVPGHDPSTPFQELEDKKQIAGLRPQTDFDEDEIVKMVDPVSRKLW
jgi:hypothetical protein